MNVSSQEPGLDPIRVLIADDHPVFRDGLRSLLESVPETEMVGEAATGQDVVESAESIQPDVVLMDIQMPGINGIEATRQILSASPHTSILILTMFEDDDLVFAAMRAGARGYLLQGADQTEIVRALQAVSSGEAIFGPAIATRMMRYFATRQPSTPAEVLPELTDREREILTLIGQGVNNPDIALRLVLSPKTVRNHVSNIFSNLHVADRVHAAIRAIYARLGTQEP